ncbi:MAG TPA: PEP/pyruvate-binding domain-containing protein [bacterium]|nr:PEP/pyruvate-binding domain-containing protein [bacterium]
MLDNIIESGIASLDQILGGLRPGDNVVWQVDSVDTYSSMARPFAGRAMAKGRRLVYVRFASHPAILAPGDGLVWMEVDPSPGFDAFSAQVNRMIEEHGPGTFYLFDNLSSLVADWATDELLANFFQVTCPFLAELDTVAYFALTRGRHSHRAVARIRDTTQVLIDAYHVKGRLYVHPLKVFDRYSAQMFLPHLYSDGVMRPVFESGEASAVSLKANHQPLANAESIAPWDSVYRRLTQYDQAELNSLAAAPEIVALKQELSRMIIGYHPEFSLLADRFLSLADILKIRNRLIGSGRIGGKAVGMLLARSILLKETGPIDFSRVLEPHDSFYIGSDVFFSFLVNNDLFRLRLRLTRSSTLSLEEFEEVEKRFLEGRFPPEIVEQFRNMLDYFGQAPIIVRSSSLLEDSFGNSFAGKYRSEFCPNQGGPEPRMEAFQKAVKLVYASAVNPDALSYRRRRGLGESDEQMAILVQRVSGTPYKHYFFPPLAGVAFSHNLYRWSDRIDPGQGMIRMVFGLGTRAVNRVGGDYPRMIAVSHPELRPEAGSRIASYSQRTTDLLDLEANALVSVPLAQVIAGYDYPNLELFVSIMEDGYPSDPVSWHGESGRDLVFTFNNLIKRTDFVKIMKEMLSRLERAYCYPIDMEFTAFPDPNGDIKINLLQCRPMRTPGVADDVVVPEDIPPERVLFRTSRTISGGIVSDIRYLIYVDPEVYAERTPMEIKRSLGRVVGQINRHPALAGSRIAMMGPGRWGSSNVLLGINAGYADINNASVLVEIAREQTGHVPELSYGTHFFQDLVEASIIYLPVFPADPDAGFNRAFFDHAPNILSRLVPAANMFEEFIKVIDVPAAAPGNFAQVVADPRKYKAICFLAEETARR